MHSPQYSKEIEQVRGWKGLLGAEYGKSTGSCFGGGSCRHDVDRIGFRFFTPKGCIAKGQTILADVLEFTGDFSLAAENLDSVVPDVVPWALSFFSFQIFLLSFQPDRDAA